MSGHVHVNDNTLVNFNGNYMLVVFVIERECLMICDIAVVTSSGGRLSVKRSDGRKSSRSKLKVQTSTRLASRKQKHLAFWGEKKVGGSGRKPVMNIEKLMYRSNGAGVITTVLELQLCDEHIMQLQKTPFWLMIEAIRVHKLDPKGYKKCDAIVCRIIQMYSPKDEKFHIGGSGLPLRNSDIRLIFGVQCGKDKLDLTQGDAMRGTTSHDEEDVAKLLCLYICTKLFFATTAESIGWAFVRIIDKLETLRLYDWTAAIRNTLIDSLNEMHGRPEKVTGCVVALLFLICEHAAIVKPDKPNMSPRFCRWNVGTLVGKLKTVELSVKGGIEVNCDKLSASIIERYFVQAGHVSKVAKEAEGVVLEVEPVNVWKERMGGVDVEEGCNVEASFDCWKPDLPGGIKFECKEVTDKSEKDSGRSCLAKETDVEIFVADDVSPVLFPDLLDLACTPEGAKVCDDVNCTKEQLSKALEQVDELKNEVRLKAERVSELENRVEKMEGIVGAQVTNLYIGFDCVLGAKDSKILRLNKVVEQLRETITRLEDQVDDHAAHVVTQSVRTSRAAIETCEHHVTNDVAAVVDVVDVVEDVNVVDIGGGNVRTFGTRLENKNIGPLQDLVRDELVDVDSGNSVEVEQVVGASPGRKIMSMVRRVKSKVRREFKLSDYEYTEVAGRGKQGVNMSNAVGLELGVISNVDDVEVERKTWSGFGMNRKFAVWNMMNEDEMKLLEDVYNLEGG
ncbi:hypothetical protein ACSBR1_009396 [Camellia fascicularis]